MKKAFALFFAVLPSTFALAAPGPNEFSKQVPNDEIPLEDLAYFFFHNAALSKRPSAHSGMLSKLISEEAINRLEPELAEITRETNDIRKHAARVRQACSDLRSATSAKEFAAVLVEVEDKGSKEHAQVARRILSKLDIEDRQALETYLDTDYRLSFGRTSLDYEAWLTSESFPSAETTRITQRVCDAVAEADARVQP